jgi:hypothetical protein
MLELLGLFLEMFLEKANIYENEREFDHDSDAYKAFSLSYDTLKEFIEDSIREQNSAIDGDAIIEYMESSISDKDVSQEYIDELESFNDMFVDILEDICL